jgi:hypothetical protein
MPIFRKQPAGMLAPFDNDERCVPSFIYFRNETASGRLCAFLAEVSTRKGVNDMEALARYRSIGPESEIASLPIVPAGYQCSWTTPSGKKTANPGIYTHLAGDFGSIFDAAAIGQFVGGVELDPNLRGFVNESCVFDPSTLAIEWHKDSFGRHVPYVRWNDQLIRINNLHIHSKQLHRFVSAADPGE